MEIETSILKISGSIYVRIPSNMADFFKLKGDMKARISDISNREASIIFPENRGDCLPIFNRKVRELMGRRRPYSLGAYNKFDDKEQWIRITEGCPHHHEYCYEPQEIRIFGIPKIVRNDVKIMDMNLLCKPEALRIIRELGAKKVNGNVVYYELVCGIDYRFLTQEIANALYDTRFKRMRIAWDWGYADQFKIKKAIGTLKKAGYKPKDLMIFMICNWKIPMHECWQKLNLCKYWNVKVADCYFDGQVMPNVKPIYWTANEIIQFRAEVRKHNQLVNFGIDPELRELSKSVQTKLWEEST